jgi:hypothetical protein
MFVLQLKNKNLKMDNSQMLPTEFLNKLENLTEREQTYFRIMWAKYGVLYITAKPGVAKSAIARSIADKMGFRYMDLRLSMVDETDVGLFPSVSESDGVKCLDHVVPRWALEANKQPTIIHFEELNRASQAVRNAALQILLERQIGINFEFNDTVLLMASGNLGDEDGTDVEEFDSALNNRLIHYKHVLTTKEWLENFAEKNVHKTITSYIKAYPEQLYKVAADGAQAYATPRSWTMLSEFITKNFGRDADPRAFLPLLKVVAASYVGNSAMKYVQYCEDMLNINIMDVLNDFDRVKDDLKKYNRDKNSELIQSLKELDLNKLSDKQVANSAKFLKTVGDDELTAYLLFILDNNLDITKPKIKAFMLEFETVLRTIKKINKPTK